MYTTRPGDYDFKGILQLYWLIYIPYSALSIIVFEHWHLKSNSFITFQLGVLETFPIETGSASSLLPHQSRISSTDTGMQTCELYL